MRKKKVWEQVTVNFNAAGLAYVISYDDAQVAPSELYFTGYAWLWAVAHHAQTAPEPCCRILSHASDMFCVQGIVALI